MWPQLGIKPRRAAAAAAAAAVCCFVLLVLLPSARLAFRRRPAAADGDFNATSPLATYMRQHFGARPIGRPRVLLETRPSFPPATKFTARPRGRPHHHLPFGFLAAWKTLRHPHCSASATKYTVVIPSVKRQDDRYLERMLSSLEVAIDASPELVDAVVLVNAHRPPSAHAFLLEWCEDHADMGFTLRCVSAPTVPESVFQSVLQRKDLRHDTDAYKRWRTQETYDAGFGLREALKVSSVSATHILWLQDDTLLDPFIFAKLDAEASREKPSRQRCPMEQRSLQQHVVCLRKSRKYCGAVAYCFAVSYVEQKLLPMLDDLKLTKPFDWIIDGSVAQHGQQIRRLGLVKHIGKQSSSGKLRASDMAGATGNSIAPDAGDALWEPRCWRASTVLARSRVKAVDLWIINGLAPCTDLDQLLGRTLTVGGGVVVDTVMVAGHSTLRWGGDAVGNALAARGFVEPEKRGFTMHGGRTARVFINGGFKADAKANALADWSMGRRWWRTARGVVSTTVYWGLVGISVVFIGLLLLVICNSPSDTRLAMEKQDRRRRRRKKRRRKNRAKETST